MRSYRYILIFLLLTKIPIFGQDVVTFENELDFKTELTGSWILKSYYDSIAKGNTPIMSQDLLNGVHGFFYNPNKRYSIVFPSDSSYWIFIDSEKNFINEGFAISFSSDYGKIIEKKYSNDYDFKLNKWVDNYSTPDTVGEFRLVKQDNEIILILDYENLETQFVKSDIEKLLNEKFIAGDYKCGDSDIISFKANGFVENLEALDKDLKNFDRYEIAVGYFPDNSDCLYFSNINSKLTVPFIWTRTGDKLMLMCLTNKDIKCELIISTPYNNVYK